MELNFAQNFSIIALNAQDSLHLTVAKKISLRCMSAATILELYLNNEFETKGNLLTISKKDLQKPSITLYQESVLNAILGKKESLTDTLPNYLTSVIKFSSKELKDIERTLVDSLKGIDFIEEIPGLLGCDLQLHTAGVLIKEYRSNMNYYTRLTESLKAEFLEDAPISDESILMLWLLRESGCLHDLFSKDDIKLLGKKMSELFETNFLAKQILPLNIHTSIEMAVKNFLSRKKEIMSTPTGSGINFAFPVFERSESIFIETEAWFSNKEDRLRDVKVRLDLYGHTYTILREGKVPLIKINNFIYEAIPTAETYQVTIHGVRLRKYPLYQY